jgi:ribosome biogenesis GTPase / thiamine phosphate phosphatase
LSSCEPEQTRFSGIVVAVQANYYRVTLDQAGPQGVTQLLCVRRSLLKKMGSLVMVGDRVWIEAPDWPSQRGAICDIMARSSELDRPPVANANQVLLVFALADPPLEPQQISRFLVKAESTGLSTLIALSKADLASPEVQRAWADRLGEWGYEVCFISVYKQLGLDRLLQQLAGRVTIVAGPSGVGKSSLINALIPDLAIRVATVSGKLSRGRHTTRHVELFDLPGGGLMADTPGFNQPDLDNTPEDLPFLFPEIRARLTDRTCQFSDCHHDCEPGCAVKEQPWERYPQYLSLRAEVTALQSLRSHTAGPDRGLKAKSKADGSTKYEPRLDREKFRRESRRSRRQGVEQVTGTLEDLTEQDP